MRKIPWWIIIVFLLFIFVIRIEPKSQDALNKNTVKMTSLDSWYLQNNPSNNYHKACHNTTVPMFKHDTINMGIDKTIETVRKNHTLVNW